MLDQGNNFYLISLHILIRCFLYNVRLLQREVSCWSLLGVKGLIRFLKSRGKGLLAAISPSIPIIITNTNHKLTTSMKVTKATNIQVRLLVEESQQLNSKKWKTRKKAKFSANEMMTISNYTQIDKRKNAIKWNKRRRAIRNRWISSLFITRIAL